MQNQGTVLSEVWCRDVSLPVSIGLRSPQLPTSSHTEDELYNRDTTEDAAARPGTPPSPSPSPAAVCCAMNTRRAPRDAEAASRNG